MDDFPQYLRGSPSGQIVSSEEYICMPTTTTSYVPELTYKLIMSVSKIVGSAPIDSNVLNDTIDATPSAHEQSRFSQGSSVPQVSYPGYSHLPIVPRSLGYSRSPSLGGMPSCNDQLNPSNQIQPRQSITQTGPVNYPQTSSKPAASQGLYNGLMPFTSSPRISTLVVSTPPFIAPMLPSQAIPHSRDPEPSSTSPPNWSAGHLNFNQAASYTLSPGTSDNSKISASRLELRPRLSHGAGFSGLPPPPDPGSSSSYHSLAVSYDTPTSPRDTGHYCPVSSPQSTSPLASFPRTLLPPPPLISDMPPTLWPQSQSQSNNHQHQQPAMPLPPLQPPPLRSIHDLASPNMLTHQYYRQSQSMFGPPSSFSPTGSNSSIGRDGGDGIGFSYRMLSSTGSYNDSSSSSLYPQVLSSVSLGGGIGNENVPRAVVTAVPTTERRFICEQCRVYFMRNHDLKRHRRIHLDQKMFKCDHCGKGFTRKDALKRHRQVRSCMNKGRREGLGSGAGASAAVGSSATVAPTIITDGASNPIVSAPVVSEVTETSASVPITQSRNDDYHDNNTSGQRFGSQDLSIETSDATRDLNKSNTQPIFQSSELVPLGLFKRREPHTDDNYNQAIRPCLQ